MARDGACGRTRRRPPIRSRSSTATCAAGRRCARSGDATDDHLSPRGRHHRAAAQGARRRARSTRSSGSPTRRSRSIRRSTARSAASVERVREQARIQVAGRGLPKPITSCSCPPEASRSSPSVAWPSLPAPDDGDLFLDLEGDPYALDDGVDYLFGVLDTDGAFTPIWSFDPDRPAKSRWPARRRRSSGSSTCSSSGSSAIPAMHVYHYAQLRAHRAEAAHGPARTREDEVDRLLRGGVLVDLFRAVRQGLRASVESYSIKRIEPLYGFEREIELRDAGSSIVAFEEWLELGEGDRPASDILDEIAALQPRRRRQHAAPARLARGAARRAGDAHGAGGSAADSASPATRRSSWPQRTRGSRRSPALTAGVSGGPSGAIRRAAGEVAAGAAPRRGIGARRRRPTGSSSTASELDATELTIDKGALGPLEVVGPVGDRICRAGEARRQNGGTGSRRRTTTSARGASSTTRRAARPIPTTA